MVSFEEKSVCDPIVIVNANGIQCRALVAAGTGSSHVSAALMEALAV